MKTCEELRKLSSATASPQDNIDMLKNVLCWQRRFLPLKKGNLGDDSFRCAVIFATHAYEKKWIVKFCNMFRMPDLYDHYMQLPGKQYESPEAIIADGWRVD